MRPSDAPSRLEIKSRTTPLRPATPGGTRPIVAPALDAAYSRCNTEATTTRLHTDPATPRATDAAQPRKNIRATTGAIAISTPHTRFKRSKSSTCMTPACQDKRGMQLTATPEAIAKTNPAPANSSSEARNATKPAYTVAEMREAHRASKRSSWSRTRHSDVFAPHRFTTSMVTPTNATVERPASCNTRPTREPLDAPCKSPARATIANACPPGRMAVRASTLPFLKKLPNIGQRIPERRAKTIMVFAGSR